MTYKNADQNIFEGETISMKIRNHHDDAQRLQQCGEQRNSGEDDDDFAPADLGDTVFALRRGSEFSRSG